MPEERSLGGLQPAGNELLCLALGALSLKSRVHSSVEAPQTGHSWTPESTRVQFSAFCFLSTTYLQGHKNVHNQKTQRHREYPPALERRVTMRGRAPLPPPAHPPQNTSVSSTTASRRTFRKPELGQRKRQTDFNPNAGRKFQVAPSERRGCSESRGLT